MDNEMNEVVTCEVTFITDIKISIEDNFTHVNTLSTFNIFPNHSTNSVTHFLMTMKFFFISFANPLTPSEISFLLCHTSSHCNEHIRTQSIFWPFDCRIKMKIVLFSHATAQQFIFSHIALAHPMHNIKLS